MLTCGVTIDCPLCVKMVFMGAYKNLAGNQHLKILSCLQHILVEPSSVVCLLELNGDQHNLLTLPDTETSQYILCCKKLYLFTLPIILINRRTTARNSLKLCLTVDQLELILVFSNVTNKSYGFNWPACTVSEQYHCTVSLCIILSGSNIYLLSYIILL